VSVKNWKFVLQFREWRVEAASLREAVVERERERERESRQTVKNSQVALLRPQRWQRECNVTSYDMISCQYQTPRGSAAATTLSNQIAFTLPRCSW